MVFWQAKFGATFEVEEASGVRIALIPIWIQLALRSTQAAAGLSEASGGDDLGGEDDGTVERDPPPLPAPPFDATGVPAAKSDHDLEVDHLLASIAAAEVTAADGRGCGC